MDRYYYAVQRAKELEVAVRAAEEDILTQLEGGGKLSSVHSAEETLAALRGELEDALTIQQYYVEQGEASASTDITQIVFHGEVVPDRFIDGSLMPSVLQWSNMEATVSGLLVQAQDVVLGVVEGPTGAAQRVADAIVNATSGTVLSTCRVQSRTYPLGLRLSCVEDDVLSKVIRRCRSIVVVGQLYAPKVCADVAARGGNPCGVPPDNHPRETPLLCVTLDTKGGRTPTTGDYAQAAVCIKGVVARYNGAALELFGEHMVVAFPTGSRFAGNPLVDSAIRILEALPGAVVCVHVGPVSMVSSANCVAVGSGILQVKRLVELAEKNRRPLVISPQATAIISKASYTLWSFSLETVLYFTLGEYEHRWLNMPPEDLVIDHIPGHVPEYSSGSNQIVYRKLNTLEQQQAWARETPNVGGAGRERELKAVFRKMDPGNCGWVSKAAFRRFLLEGSTYTIFPHDAKRVEGWISSAGAVGPDRMSFAEFALICLKLDQL